jgi:uncharacterized membrane protein YozB (DUF420 family)
MVNETMKDLPTINAILNMISFVLLILGRIYILNSNRPAHKKFMIAALSSSTVFLLFYIFYHANVGSVPYPHHDWTRPVYFVILVPHIILATVMTPFIFVAVFYAVRAQFDKHLRIVHWLWPVWIYVSLSGVAVYLMLYVL